MSIEKSERFDAGEFEPIILDDDERRRLEAQTGRKFGGQRIARIQPTPEQWRELTSQLIRRLANDMGEK